MQNSINDEWKKDRIGSAINGTNPMIITKMNGTILMSDRMVRMMLNSTLVGFLILLYSLATDSNCCNFFWRRYSRHFSFSIFFASP